MSFWDFILGKKTHYNRNKERSVNVPKQRQMSELKSGEKVRINYYSTIEQVYAAYVLSNNIGKSEIYIRIPKKGRNNDDYEVRGYDHYYFRNFSTINPEHMIEFEQDEKPKTTVEKLVAIQKDCEKKEDYETAGIIKETILKLKK